MTTKAQFVNQGALAIEIVGLSKRYGDVEALQPTDLGIQAGEFLVLLGPSGCGKSTLLKLIAGLEDPTDGEIYINGRLANYLRPGDRDVAMVFQNYALYPHMTVRTNLGFPLKMRRRPAEEIATKVADVANLLELREQLDRYPDQLSGGQRQRVALGRAIIREPVAFLMDEPLSNLDALLRVQMRSELMKIHRRVGRTTIYVTHDQVEAMTMANRMVVLRHGLIQQVGLTSEIYARPANTFVATFVGSPPMNLMRGRLASGSGARRFEGPASFDLTDVGAIELPDGDVTIGIRPEEALIVGENDPFDVAATIELVEEVGSDAFLSLIIAPGASAIIRVAPDRQFSEGAKVHLRLPRDRIRLFDAGGVRVPLLKEAR